METKEITMLVSRKVWAIVDKKAALVEAVTGDTITVTERNAKILIEAGQAEEKQKSTAKKKAVTKKIGG